MRANPTVLSVYRSGAGVEFQTGGGLCRERLHEALRASQLRVNECELRASTSLRARAARLRAEVWCGWPFYAPQRDDCATLGAALAEKDVDCIIVEEVETAAAVLPLVVARRRVSSARWVLYSHGLFSQDHFHDFPRGNPRSYLKRVRRIAHQGRLMAREQQVFEAFDAVWVLNEQELEIARWLGARALRVVPQACLPTDLVRRPVPGRFGFVGTLTHAPNRQGLDALIEEMARRGPALGTVDLRVVGAPPPGHAARWSSCASVRLLGLLGDAELAREASSWAAMVHPLFVWAKGRSLKVARALEWGIPLISTPAGIRGYPLQPEVHAIVADTPAGFVDSMRGPGSDPELLRRIAEAATRVRIERLSLENVSLDLRQAVNDLVSKPRAGRSPAA